MTYIPDKVVELGTVSFFLSPPPPSPGDFDQYLSEDNSALSKSNNSSVSVEPSGQYCLDGSFLSDKDLGEVDGQFLHARWWL